MIVVPYKELSDQALLGLLEEYASREGTEYGWHEVPMEAKVKQLKAQLDNGSVCVVYDQKADSCNLVLAQDLQTIDL